VSISRIGIYDEIGTRPVINAWGSVTIMGGSLMPRPVVEAMVEAAGSFVVLQDLQRRAGERIAELVGVEAAIVSSGAAGGILLSASACLTGKDVSLVHRLPHTDGIPNEIVVAKSGRPNYMYQAAEMAGARLVEVGSESQLSAADFAAAIGTRTAAVMLVVATLDRQRLASPGVTATIENVAALARRANVPLIVDAAAEMPPVANFRRFLELGADLAIFSGGKALRGPQASGIVVGRKDLIEAAALNNNPNSAVGRPTKVGKEEIAGLVRAVDLYVHRDESAEMRNWEAVAQRIVDGLTGLPGVRTEITRDGRHSRPPGMPVGEVHLDPAVVRVTKTEAQQRLLTGEPAVGMGTFDDGLVVNPMMLAPREEDVVIRQLRAVLSGA
jgi:L-seryl-tRNA(Ser) seleniumtransferase